MKYLFLKGFAFKEVLGAKFKKHLSKLLNIKYIFSNVKVEKKYV